VSSGAYTGLMPTMDDVAELSGLSRVTVSKVLNGHGVRAKTRTRVLDACQKLNFVPNQHAATLARGGSRLMGLIVTSITDPFYNRIIETAERTATQLGFDLAYRCSYSDPEQERRVVDAFLGLKAISLIVSPVPSQTNARFWRQLSRQLPIVFIDHATLPSCHLVATDHYAGACLVTEHLLKQAERVAYLGSTEPLENTAIAARLQGYLDSVARAKRPALVLPAGPKDEAGDTEQFGYDSVRAFLQGCATKPFDALTCATDSIALGAMNALRAAGFEPGRDVLVAGHDDLSFSSFLTPPLTSVRQPRVGIGEAAVQAAIDLVKSPRGKRKLVDVKLAPELVVRASTRT
jgi:DNA-binding LacI/PurR family transcriptional regulator